jgi:hypothetical protein
MAAQGSLGNEFASVIDSLLYAVRGFFAIVGNIGPNFENIGFCKGR